MKRNEILEEVSDFLIIYMKAGKVGINSFIKKAELNISQLDQLLMIHFLLREDVKQFIRELPILIRRFRTSTKMENETYIGEVRGQIHWSNTLKERIKMNHRDRTIFSCTENIRNYNIPENLVLKELLHTLYSILFVKLDTSRLENYAYFEEWRVLKDSVSELLRKNIYLSKVDVNKNKVTSRMIQKTLTHRHSLYRQAAKLLLEYREMMKANMNKELLQALLSETFIFPEKEEVLFELFWTIQLIKNSTQHAQLQLIASGRNNLVASWEMDEHTYHIYHDSVGSTNISFHISSDEVSRIDHPYIRKKLTSKRNALQLTQDVFKSNFDISTYWRGRPDIIVEVYSIHTGELKKLVIGEVKDTKRTEYAITGLRELLDYMELVRDKNGEYLKEKSENLVEGRLFIGEIDIQGSQNDHVNIHTLLNIDEQSLNVILT